MAGSADRSSPRLPRGARSWLLLAAPLAASTAGCSLVTSWGGYVGDAADGGAGDGQADTGGQDDGGVYGDSNAPDSPASDDATTGDSTIGDAAGIDGQSGDALASDGPSEEGAPGDAAAGDGGNADASGNDGATDASTTPITFVQVTAATPSGSVSTASTTFAQAQDAGDLVVLVIGWGGAATITQVSDSAGNGYAPAVGPTHINAGVSQSIFYAKGIAAAPAGANTVTVTLSASTTALDLCAAEYAGLDPVTPLDTSAAFGGRSTSASSGSVTTGAARELVFGAGTTLGSFTGAGAAFTLRKLTGGGLGVVEDRIVSNTGSYSADAPLASSAYYVMQVATFR